MSPSIACILLTVSFASVAAQSLEGEQWAVVTMRGGEAQRCEVVSADHDSVTLVLEQKLKSGRTMRAQMAIPRSDIDVIVPGSSIETDYEAKRKSMMQTIEGHLRLMQWCNEHYLEHAAIEQAQQVLALDASQREAKRLLREAGLIQEEDGTWVDREEYMDRHGLVLVDGEMVSEARAAEIEAKEELRWRRESNERRRLEAAGDSVSLQDQIRATESELTSLAGRIRAARQRVTAAESNAATNHSSYRYYSGLAASYWRNYNRRSSYYDSMTARYRSSYGSARSAIRSAKTDLKRLQSKESFTRNRLKRMQSALRRARLTEDRAAERLDNLARRQQEERREQRQRAEQGSEAASPSTSTGPQPLPPGAERAAGSAVRLTIVSGTMVVLDDRSIWKIVGETSPADAWQAKDSITVLQAGGTTTLVNTDRNSAVVVQAIEQ